MRAALLLALVCAFVRVAAAAPVTIRGQQIVLAQPIYFDAAKATIKPQSRASLDALAALLAKDKRLALVEIGVHTDARGNDEWNLKLSQARAEAIHAYLVQKGVDPARLRAKGYGETRPIDRGTSAAAMAKNRRTTFTILQRITT